MATGVVFGSPASLILQPGSYSRVDGSNLSFAPPFAYNVVAIMGAGLGGAPLTPYVFNDPTQAQQLFGAGTPLADAIRFAFQGGVNGGATAVIGVRVDNAAQAYGSLTDVNSGTALDAKFKDYGAYGNTYSLAFYPGSVAGTMALITGKYIDGRDYTQKFDNYTSFSRLITKINQESPIDVTLTAGGSSATQTLSFATSQTDGRATLTDSQGTARSNQAYIYQYPASMLENIVDSMRVSFNGALSWAIDSINAGTDVITTSANHAFTPGNFVRFSGTTLPTGIDDELQYIVYAAASATTFTVVAVSASPQQWAVSAINAGSDLVTAPGHGLADGDVVQIEGTTIPTGLTKGRNYFVVGTSGDNFQVALTAGGSAVDISGSVASCLVKKMAGSTLVDISGSVSGAIAYVDPGYAVVSSSNPSTFNGGRVAANTEPGYTQAVTGATFTAAAYASDSARLTLNNGNTWGHADGRGLPGSIFTIASGVYTGTYQVTHFEWDGLSDDVVRVVRKLTGDRAIAEGSYTGNLVFYPSIGFPRTQPATEALETQLPANGLLATGGQYVTGAIGESTYYYTTEPGDTIQLVGQTVADQINEDESSPVVASAAYNAGTYTSTVTLVAKIPGTEANQLEVRLFVNAQTTLLVSTGGSRLTGGIDPSPPRAANGLISGSLILSNGYDSVPTYQRWIDGLEVIKNVPCRWIVPTTDDVGVQTLFVDHAVLQSSTPKRRERVAVLGHGSGWTAQQIRERAELFQSERAVFVSPCKGRYLAPDGVTGALRSYPHWYAASMIAGILAAEGNGISDPITHTYLRNVSLESTYQPGSVELDQMIDSGVLTFERDPSITRASRGFRITRAITTFRVIGVSATRSNAFESISVVNQSDFIAASIREMEEALFIGQAIFPDTLENIRLAVNLELARRSRERIIYGYDPEFTQVSLSPDSPNAVNVVYKCFPAPALEFILNTQLLFPIPTDT